ncbi:MAG: SDR family oxidoreductase [Candidatus Competibacteraceae bacterium]|nr:SDR family oxidoreductase [Candidatus Competibacteraceae bacterium]
MENKRYLVTGGSSGTGRATALKLTRGGANVVIWGRKAEKLQAAVDEGVALSFTCVDVANPDLVEKGFRGLEDEGIQLDGVVHAAGIWTAGYLHEVSTDILVRHIAGIVTGATLVARRAVIHMQDTPGDIIMIAAASGKAGYPDTALNILAKRAVDGLQDGLSRELMGSSVRVSTIYPDSISAADGKSVASGKSMRYEDVAETVCFILNSSRTVKIREVLLTAPNA